MFNKKSNFAASFLAFLVLFGVLAFVGFRPAIATAADAVAIPSSLNARLAALEAGTGAPEVTANNAMFRTNVTVGGVINGAYTIGTTNIAAGTLPGGVRASGTNLNGNVPASQIAAGDLAGGVRASGTNLNGTVPIASLASGYAAADIAAGDLAGGVRASGTNLNGTVPLGSIARTTGWTNTVITAFAFNGSNEVVMTKKTLSYDGLTIAEGSGVIVTNTY